MFSSDRVSADEDLLLSSRQSVETDICYDPPGSSGPASYSPSRYGLWERSMTWVRAVHFRRREQVARLARYTATSGLAFAMSEAILLVLVGTGATGATVAAMTANVTTMVPSYFMSRYWIWKDAERNRVARQVVLYWVTAVVSWVLIALATGAIAKAIPQGHRFHILLIGIGFMVVNGVFFVAKFAVYHKFIFPSGRSGEQEVTSPPS